MSFHNSIVYLYKFDKISSQTHPSRIFLSCSPLFLIRVRSNASGGGTRSSTTNNSIIHPFCLFQERVLLLTTLNQSTTSKQKRPEKRHGEGGTDMYFLDKTETTRLSELLKVHCAHLVISEGILSWSDPYGLHVNYEYTAAVPVHKQLLLLYLWYLTVVRMRSDRYYV